MTDADLLRLYAAKGERDTFAELVRRHVDLVYAAARRQVGGDHHRAQEVVQEVFVRLARDAARVSAHPAPVAWLYRCTGWSAKRLRRAEGRRVKREDAAAQLAEMAGAQTDQGASWAEVEAVLDEALATLGERERAAVLLRFFQQRSYAEVGAALGVAENAARMRTERALEKLRAALARRGVRSTAEALGLALGAQAVSAAPAGVAPAALAAGLAAGAGAAAGSGMVAAAGVFFMKQVKLVGVAVVAAGLASWATYELVSRENRAPVAAASTTQAAPTTPAAPAEDARAAELEAENAALRARLAAAEERAARDAAELKAARDRLAELRRPLVADMRSSTLRATTRPGEVIVTGGSVTEDGRRLFAFVTPDAQARAKLGQVDVAAKVMAIPEPLAQELGLGSLLTRASNTLQHGEVWTPDELARVMGRIQAYKATPVTVDGLELLPGETEAQAIKRLQRRASVDTLSAPKVTMIPGNEGTISVGQENAGGEFVGVRMKVRPEAPAADGTIETEFRLEVTGVDAAVEAERMASEPYYGPTITRDSDGRIITHTRSRTTAGPGGR